MVGWLLCILKVPPIHLVPGFFVILLLCKFPTSTNPWRCSTRPSSERTASRRRRSRWMSSSDGWLVVVYFKVSPNPSRAQILCHFVVCKFPTSTNPRRCSTRAPQLRRDSIPSSIALNVPPPGHLLLGTIFFQPLFTICCSAVEFSPAA